MGKEINVGVRCRPMNSREIANGETTSLEFFKSSIITHHPNPAQLKPTDDPTSQFNFGAFS